MFNAQRIKAARTAAQRALREARAAHSDATARLEKHEALRGTMPAADHMTGRMSIKGDATARIRATSEAVPAAELAALVAELSLPSILKRARTLPALDKDYHDALAVDTRELRQLAIRRELRDGVADMTPAEIAADIASIAASFGPNDPDGGALERFAVLSNHVQRHGNGNEWTDARAALSIATSKLENDWKGRAELVGDVEYVATALRTAAAYEGAIDAPRDKWPAPALLDVHGFVDGQQQAA